MIRVITLKRTETALSHTVNRSERKRHLRENVAIVSRRCIKCHASQMHDVASAVAEGDSDRRMFPKCHASQMHDAASAVAGGDSDRRMFNFALRRVSFCICSVQIKAPCPKRRRKVLLRCRLSASDKEWFRAYHIRKKVRMEQ